MIPRSIYPLILTALGASPIALQSQTDTASGIAVRTETSVVRIRRHAVLGLRVEASSAPTNHPGQPRRVRGHFDPETFRPWLDATTMVTAPAHLPVDLYALLQSPTIGTPIGDTIRLWRRSLGATWDTNVTFRLVAIRGGSIEIPLTPAQVAAVLQGMRQEADGSGFHPDSVRAVVADRRPVGRSDAIRPPVPLSPPGMRPPRGAPRGQVLLEVVIDTNGRPDPETVDVLWADHDILIPAARMAIQQMRFAPATIDGRPARLPIRLQLRH